MTLIKSISGIRGTLGGRSGETLSPIDVVKFAAAYGAWLLSKPVAHKVIIGRDARLSGRMVAQLVASTLQAQGIDVVDLDLATTPTVEMAVVWEKAGGGIILTASHNPAEWNALKLLNEKGEFINDAEGKAIVQQAEQEDFVFADVHALGSYTTQTNALAQHIEAILALPLVKPALIQQAGFSVAVDAVCSVGGLAVPALLEALGVKQVHRLHCEPTGHFPHNPEPLPEHLTEIAALVKAQQLDLGIVVDPDVDRLALVCEDGSMFGEEYTLVAAADYILRHTPGATVSNLSSTRALRDVTEGYQQTYSAAAVGEVNVVHKMKATKAVIGGEGNGGIIYPELHYGRDALVGIALILTHLAEQKCTLSALRKRYPAYAMSKLKIELQPGMDTEAILQHCQQLYQQQPHSTEDGLKIEFEQSWVHLRRSNTEPIIRIYTEAPDAPQANALGQRFMQEIKQFISVESA
ncbi:MAG TPA: phosphoglucosamine mutase [Microscillaceae bacterium]|nr:phosphoglucosamine mutase [Microscillaceae bacterium]